MLEFIKNNWKDIIELIVGLIIGFGGGMVYKSLRIKNVTKIKGNNNSVIQKGNEINGSKK